MKKEIIKYVGIAVIVLLLLISGIVITLIPAKPEIKESKPIESTVSSERSTPADSMAGDPGLSDEEMTSVQRMVPANKSRDAMVQRILEYTGYIPFLEGGRYYGDEFPKIDGGIDNRYNDEKVGMDSLGYVEWMYYYFFEEIINPLELLKNGKEITVDELRPGDIGMYHRESTSNHYGIFIGYDRSIPVFAHCSSMPEEKYIQGVTRLSGLAYNGNGYYNGLPLEKFCCFVRPEVPWSSEEYTMDITAILQDMRQEEIMVRNQCGDFGMKIFDMITAGEEKGVSDYLAENEIQARGYSLDYGTLQVKLSEWKELLNEKRVIIYNADKLSSAEGYVVRFFLMPEVEGKVEVVYDAAAGYWLDLTFFCDKNGDIISFLPFHVSMISEYGGLYGVTKMTQQ